MNLNYVLLWIVGLSALMMVVRLLGHRSRETRGWLLTAALALGLIVAGLILFPGEAGLVAGGFWLLFVLVPMFGSRWMQRQTLKQEYGKARRLFRWLRWLQPFANGREQDDVLHAKDLAQQGDLDAVRPMLDRHGAAGSAHARMAMILYFRLGNQWDAMGNWCRSMGLDQTVTRDINILTSYVRALGETGDLNDLLATIDRHARHLSAAHMALASDLCNLMAFAFCGRRAAVEGLFQNRLRDYPVDVKTFWLATAGMAAGDVEPSRHALERLRLSPVRLTCRAAAYRMQTPLANPAEVLTDAARQILNRLENESLVDRRYGEPGGGTRGFRAYATYALVAINIAVFIVEIAAGGSENDAVLLRLGALHVPAVMAGEWWRIPASTVLHFGYLHLLLNMLGLYLLGPYLEARLGRVRYVIVYLFIGSGAAGLTVLLAGLHLVPATGICVGASGGILGLVGGAAAVLLRGWQQHRSRLLGRRLGAIGMIIVLQMLFDFLTPQISHTAHIGGILIGFLAVWFLPLRIPEVNVPT